MERPPAREIPDAPGAYLFRDGHGRVIYVGKAKSLRKRVLSYFGRELHLRTSVMVDSARDVEWIVAGSEVEAIMLEYSLIKAHRPRFNIRLRDDKSYPYLAITRSDKWPRAHVMRGKRRKGTAYYGPYAHTYAIRKTLDLVLRTFPVRTCSDSLFRRQHLQGRPCLLFHIEKCSGPCVGEVSEEEYGQAVDGLSSFLQGDIDHIVDGLTNSMQQASDDLEYEAAARYRDRLTDLEKALARQEMVTDRRENFDLIARHGDELETAIWVLFVRRGRVVGQLGSVVDRVEELSDQELIGSMLRELYGDRAPPSLVLIPEQPPDPEVFGEWLAQQRGGRVELRVPQRGGKRRLMETAAANAREKFGRHRLRRQSDHNARARSLRSLQEVLGLPQPPLRIEAFDVSTLMGTHTVASMVVMEDGLPRKAEYRRFKIRRVRGQDDFAAMEEAIRRRFTAYLASRDQPDHQQSRFRYPPSLVVIDGGVGQLGRAVRVLDELDLDIPVIGLAKRMEEVYFPDLAEPLRISRRAEALYLLQRVRDEAHRFAVEYHRKLRSKGMIDSLLDEAPGIGPVRKRALLRKFGSLRRLREADAAELAEVVPAAVADDLYLLLHGK
ncbi:MAG: excinuclease ABC subunit UvrC [bacterium]|nr:excinuclease ABC subunit UvrC [Acidimicrobiia bacterium]MCY4650783.1 excinuclease ABC subunit UvrC [bacterium]